MKLSILILCIFATAVLSNPIESNQRLLSFKIPNEWNLVPDVEGRLRMLHRSEILDKGLKAQPFYDAEADIRFHLFTRSNPTEAQVFSYANIDEIVNSNFDERNPTRFTVHGWNGDLSSNVNMGVIRESLVHGEFNMIAVDWSAGAGTIDYVAARDRVRVTGAVLGQLIDRMVIGGLINLSQLTLIGHSLGGHVVGMAGKNVATGTVNTIISLDPAGPLFNVDDATDRVDVNDAEYVEIIHTNGGLLGMMAAIGDADFYPNGGGSQPGCGLDLTGSCAHARSHEFYVESITTDQHFWSLHCTSFGSVSSSGCEVSGSDNHIMGGEQAYHKGSRGIFFTFTNSQAPFALGPLE